MIRATSHFELSQRGADIDYADFVFWKRRGCAAYAWFDCEEEPLYMDAKDLRGAVLALDAIACMRCALLAGFQEATGKDLAAILAGERGFAL